ncbi:Transcriptional protein SWT1 [Dufourea novaeangliae]|uniref:Transcriptional protein SWT1 n=1 Tax=Dufourea novaeangliae TaxID=178035 RepID=A0A154P992_DUFNO|nr:Transcriptional protein SWT1 [Dufourea novaeangliae]
MMKQKLPENWIVVNSKTYPHRVYYFNVKTNESSWEVPTANQPEKVAKESGGLRKKRKKHEPSTPESNISEYNEISKRKKLVAKRSLRHSMEKNTEERETPQMQAIREKMLKKKEKESTSKAQSHKSLKDSMKSLPLKNKTMTPSPSKSESDEGVKTTYTPQMQVILQKIQEKAKSVPRVKKNQEIKNNNNKNQQETVKSQRSRNKEKTGTRRKISDQSLIEGTSTKRGRKSFKKNIGKERMEELRKSLTLQNSTVESSDSTANTPPESPSSVDKQGKLPSIYKNAEVRLVRLRSRLSTNKIEVTKASINKKPEKLSRESVTTVNELVKRSNEDSFYEEMDWEPLEDEKITFEVQAVRTQLCTEHNTHVSCSAPSNSLSCPPLSEQPEKRQLYIVVDTNVFLSNIDAIELAKETTFKTFDRILLVIPWTVIRELDYIKDDNSKTKPASLCANARKAINYINKLFSAKHPRVIGQTREDALRNKEKFSIDCPDDEILQTCLQIRELEKSVVLISYDTNLRNKAMIYDIATLGRNDVEFRHWFDFKKILCHLQKILLQIVSKEMHELYGQSWEKHVIIRPPWTTVTVLQCAIKHWIAAVSESFSRKAETILKELLQIFKTTCGERTLKEVSCILNKCSDLIQLINISKHPDLMLRVSQKIDELKQTCRNFETQLNNKKLHDAIGVENDVAERERRAQKAFQYFETAYIFARDIGLAADAVKMPCSFHYSIPNPLPSSDYVKQIQPELAANVNRLLQSLGAVLEQAKDSSIDYRTLNSLYQALVTFLPETMTTMKIPDDDLTPLDVHCCVKQKEDVLKTGLRQLQELSTHFCRLASCRCT